MNTELIIIIVGVVATLLLAALAMLKKQEIRIETDRLNEELEADMNMKINDIKNDVLEIVEKAVQYTNQTYVDELKKQGDGKLTKEQQAEAFKRTYERVKDLMTNEAEVYLNEFVRDVPLYIKTIIEATVQLNK